MSESTVIRSAGQYQQAILEVQLLETALDDGATRRRHLLLAAMHLYEQKYLHPDFKPGKPAPFSIKQR